MSPWGEMPRRVLSWFPPIHGSVLLLSGRGRPGHRRVHPFFQSQKGSFRQLCACVAKRHEQYRGVEGTVGGGEMSTESGTEIVYVAPS